MGMFTNLMAKIFGHASAAPTATVTTPSTTIESATAPSATTPAASAVAPATAAPAAAPEVASAPAQAVDVTAILDGLAAKNPEKLEWKKSIVDLLKLVDMDSSLSARKQLATELHYPGDENDSATMNVWLHKEVLRQLSEHGGKIPRELL
jgi:3-oxoacyl-ACP reductase-like protein